MKIDSGILKPPFFHPHAPHYYSYGVIGFIIGHEFTHSVSGHGLQFDERGFLRSWATATATAAFNVKNAGIVEQYNNYTTPAGKVNGEETLSENIADNGGIRAAYEAYRRHLERLPYGEDVIKELENYSPDQLFFLSTAQAFCYKTRPGEEHIPLFTNRHSPPKWRINGMMSNMREFAAAFNCSTSARMNPRDKQSVW
ncbi:endothelin-converting enzyme 1-like [Paramacrobiotus metropolitanus]|uniref:endothelin-converting enzyme 1-like n=1 Tax=Paramacrobiotus metropolitanus TaxID=2943436 RepID=UPI002445D191|nr:endothelin-converting enzyme 1-like [Paramacrobiotus metropolitanus]